MKPELLIIEQAQEELIKRAVNNVNGTNKVSGVEQLGMAIMYFNLELKKRGVFKKEETTT